MSLLDAFKEPFFIMEKRRYSDGAGGFNTIWAEGASIDLVMRHDTTIEAQQAEKQGTASTYSFFFDQKVALAYNDVVKRKRDGQIFRITQDSGEDYTPSSSGLNLGMVTAVKWELPK